MLDAAAILAADDLAKEAVSVPEWGAGAEVFVRVMTGNERDVMEQRYIALKDNKAAPNLRAGLLALCLCSADGKRLFDDSQIQLLGGKSSVVLDRLFDAALRINGMGNRDIKELEGN